MKQLLTLFYDYQANIYKGLLFAFSVFFIVYVLPIKTQFAFEFSKGDYWAYETLYAPFDFAIIKDAAEIQQEKERLSVEAITYFDVDTAVVSQVLDAYALNFKNYFPLKPQTSRYQRYYDYGIEVLESIYDKGVLPVNYNHKGGRTIAQIQGRAERDIPFSSLLNLNELTSYLEQTLDQGYRRYHKSYYNLFFEILEPNLQYNTVYSKRSLDELYAKISPTRGLVRKGERIISSNALVDGTKWEKLRSLEQQFSSENNRATDNLWSLTGYTLIVILLLVILTLFIYQYRQDIFKDNTQLTFLFFNVLLMIGLSSTVINFDSAYIYALPICIFPLITKAFFDPRLGLFIHVLTVVLVGFIVPNSFEYVVLQILAGMVTILSADELYKRANLFLTVFQITLVYLLGYFSFYVIRNAEIQSVDLLVFGLFITNGMLTLFVQPLIYLYEKVFGLVSDVSLLELSDTNSPVFRVLSNKAPGTFHHSLQVANLAEAAADAIDANVLLTRVGALYHDIGKINRPNFFSENQRGSVSPHDDLSPKESARIIINHVLEGIELAKKYNLPDRVIDFIRTHHGTSKVYYFYKKQQAIDASVSTKAFSYKGPKPFSKETAIVMMADAVEAASKSIKEPTKESLENFVTKIIDTQMEEKQFLNANITLAEIETVKKILLNKLINIYQLRVEYPE